MAAPKGHKINKGKKNARKLKTPDLMKKVYKSYCDHLAAGKVKKSWCYDGDGLTLTWETMEKYIAEEPNNFDPFKKAAAFSQGMKYWEGVLESKAAGQNKDPDVAALQMIMRNKYGWDRDDHAAKETTQPMIKALAKKWRGNEH